MYFSTLQVTTSHRTVAQTAFVLNMIFCLRGPHNEQQRRVLRIIYIEKTIKNIFWNTLGLILDDLGPRALRQRRVLRTIYIKKLSKTYSRTPQKSFCLIWELFDFSQFLAHEGPKSGKFVNGSVCKVQFECINLERYNLVRTSEKSIFAVQCNTSHHKP